MSTGRITPDASVMARFWAKVDKTDPSGCWLWTAGKDVKGYGHFSYQQRNIKAYRFIFLALRMINPDQHIDHICRVRACVNPAHLRAVTIKQNNENHNGQAKSNNHSSGVRGVSWKARSRKWVVVVRHDRKDIHIGYFFDLDEAERAAIAARNRYHTHNDADRKVA